MSIIVAWRMFGKEKKINLKEVKMSYMLSNAVRYLEYPGMNGTTKAILRNLLDHADDDGTNIFPSVSTICEETGFDRKAVFKALKALRGTLLEVCEAINLGGRIGKINKMALLKDIFLSSITNEKEKNRTTDFLFRGQLARPQSGTSNQFANTQSGTSNEFARPQKGLASPQSGTQLNQYSYTKPNNNTKALGSTKYPEENSAPRGSVVVPVEYNGFDNLPKPDHQERLNERQTVSQPSRNASDKSDTKTMELPESIVDALNAGNFWNAFVNSQHDLSKIIQSHGEKYVLEKIELMNTSSVKIRNPRKWLERAIEKNYQQPENNSESRGQKEGSYWKEGLSDEDKRQRDECIKWWNEVSDDYDKDQVLLRSEAFLKKAKECQVSKDWSYFFSQEFYDSFEFRWCVRTYRQAVENAIYLKKQEEKRKKMEEAEMSGMSAFDVILQDVTASVGARNAI